MKIKNLLLVPLLSAALVATSACSLPGGGDDSSSSEPSTSQPAAKPVSRISVKARANSIVGEQLDLDTLVDVFYEDGSKDKGYTLEVQAASSDLVSVTGHVIEFLAEGTVNINVKAGAKQAKFTTSVMSALRAAFAEEIGSLSDTWAMLEVGDDDSIALGAVHRPDYTYFSGWDEDEQGNELPGGFMRAGNGKTYTYTFNAQGQLEVDPEIYPSDFSRYYCNYDFLLDASDFETVTLEDQSGEPFEALYMSKDIKGTWGREDIASNKIAEFAYTLARALNSAYEFSGLYVYETELQVGESEYVSAFEFLLEISQKSTKQVAGYYDYIMFNDVASTEVTPVRDYIDSGETPEAIDFHEIREAVTNLATGKNYTATVTGCWYTTQGDQPTDCPEEFEKYESYFFAGTEIDYATADGVCFTYTTSTNKTLYEGAIKHSDALYTFTNVEEGSLTDTIKATAEEGSDVWEANVNLTIKAADEGSLWTDFYATSREESEGQLIIGSDGKNCNYELFDAILNSTYFGQDLDWILNALYVEDETDLVISYLDVAFILTESTFTIAFELNGFATGVYYGYQLVYSNIGTTVLPEALNNIVYPN